ncbi:MAG: adenosylmethionine--8-amino-7-oxononanoate transaminase [Gammaproteobacteria bacterium]|nr:adenosylmethionine--8-amino-7-oxononanoate transaminase [Gammaproteobacteria bacterium]
MMLSERDRAVIWHPLTQHQTANLPVPIVRGSGSYLYDEQGKSYLDLVSSWWVNLHGHSHPEIAEAIYEQAKTLEHVIFAGFTHEPAVQLAEKLLEILPAGFAKVFYSDNGSTSVEVALKMAYQYWRNHGETKRKRFIAFDGGYHGDTFGAMSIGKNLTYHMHFLDLLFSVDLFSYPATWIADKSAIEKEERVLNQIAEFLEKYADETVALILEPLIQGAAGMQMCTERFLKKLEKLIRSYGILIIYDEVMTGFGRTGDYFACTKSSTTPDIICLSKGISGGFLPLAATVCHEKIYEAFLGDTFAKALAHSHSYSANPLGCAAALASMKLLHQSADKRLSIEKTHHEELARLMLLTGIEKPRYCGTIAAFDFNLGGYASQNSRQLQKRFVDRGLLLRPLGDVIYFLPPYCITDAELRGAYDIVIEEIQGVIA